MTVGSSRIETDIPPPKASPAFRYLETGGDWQLDLTNMPGGPNSKYLLVLGNTLQGVYIKQKNRRSS